MTDKIKKTQEIKKPDKAEKTYDLSKTSDLLSIFRDNISDNEVKKLIAIHISNLVKKYNLESYRTVLLYDDTDHLSKHHSNKIYDALSDLNKQNDILMVLVSNGGSIEPAYLISKVCRRLSKEKFIVSIPRRAKSAATLITLGANEIHMGLLSELGPIDPQFDGFPASGLSNALEKIAYLCQKNPNSSEMFAKYLSDTLSIKLLGYFERINESAVQYAQRLLNGKKFPDGWTAISLAEHFTNHYKDHNFVIDADEALGLLGGEIIKESSNEYLFGNELYIFLDFVSFLFGIFKKKNMRYVGSINEGLDLNDQKE